MTFILFLTIALFVSEIAESKSGLPVTTVQPCPPHETFQSCGTSCEPSCSNTSPKDCRANCQNNGCQCDKGYYRSLSGRCVTMDQCDHIITCDDVTCPCGKCIQDSGSPKPPLRCSDGSDITCKNVKCKAGYHCVQNTVFCIRAPCPQPLPYCQKNNNCGENEEFLTCGKQCEPKCGEPVVRPCVDNGRCVPNVCQCKKGYFRNVMNNKCILPKDCPPVKG